MGRVAMGSAGDREKKMIHRERRQKKTSECEEEE